VRRVLVFGSRGFSGVQLVWDVMRSHLCEADVVTHGACPHGVNGDGSQRFSPDEGAQDIADAWGYETDPHPANVDKHGSPAAFHIRNREMAATLDPARDIACGFWDGVSRGTLNMSQELTKRGIRHRLYVVPTPAKVSK